MRLVRLLLFVLSAAASTSSLHAQSLRGSRATVNRVYGHAIVNDITFYRTPVAVRVAASRGKLVPLGGNSDYRVHGVNYPYVLPATRTFIARFSKQYRAVCNEKLVVTSGVRPSSFRLANSVDKSVHPTGMAVDLRKPSRRHCLAWVRKTLLHLEAQGAIEGTEERRPPHFHVVIFPGPYTRYAASGGRSVGTASTPSRARPSARERSASRPSAGRSSYRVRRGDSLWTIARRHGISVERLKAANGLRTSKVRPGQRLVIPAR